MGTGPDRGGPGAGGAGDGGRPRRAGKPRLEDMLAADDTPLRRELRRQIAGLERRLSTFRVEQAPFDQLPPRPNRGPAILTTEQLEHIRDELVATLDQLRDRVASRLADRMHESPGAPEFLSGEPDRAARGRAEELDARRGAGEFDVSGGAAGVDISADPDRFDFATGAPRPQDPAATEGPEHRDGPGRPDAWAARRRRFAGTVRRALRRRAR